MFGAGIDIGTTTVQAELVDLDTGKILQAVSVLNEQREFGADVMSRIASAREGKTQKLYAAINNQVEEILWQFIYRWDIPEIEHCAISGNTIMLHLLAGCDPSAMGEAPYSPVFLEERQFAGSELSFPANRVTLLPGISAFVGADIVAGLAYINICGKKGNTLFVDIGTNGEIAVWNGGAKDKRLLCASTAAGPCFEQDDISYGSDLIDALAEMKKRGEINENGAIAGEFAHNGYASEKGFIVTPEIVRRYQLAKSAIYSGISVLCRAAGVEQHTLDEAYIAGGMGFHVNLKNAAETGLLPACVINKAKVCGNTSLKGTVQSLTDGGFLQKCKEIIAYSSVIDLAVDKEFSEAYIENMKF